MKHNFDEPTKAPKSHPILTLAQDQVDATPAMQAAADAVLNETIHDGGEVFKKVEAVDPYAGLKAAHAEGKVIEVKDSRSGEWCPAKVNHNWTFPVEAYRVKPTPSTFTAHGKTWTRHVPGDSMPCDGEAVIHHILEWQLEQEDEEMPQVIAGHCKWDTSLHKTKQCIVGWRYTDEPSGKSTSEATITPEWTPAVGDVVTLKSGGPKMTVNSIKDGVLCNYFDADGKLRASYFPTATLTKADS